MITVVFGNPGTGKTTWAVKQMVKQRRKYKNVIATFPHSVPGGGVYDTMSGFGSWRPPEHTLLLWDESGIDNNSRMYKQMTQMSIALHKKHRHGKFDQIHISQAFDDMDITIRRLTEEYWILYRIGPWTLGRRIYKRVGVDQQTEQIVDKYRMANILWLLIFPLQLGWPFEKKFTLTFRPFYYRYFDSWDMDKIPIREPHYNAKK